MKSPQPVEQEKAEAALDQLSALIHSITQAALLAAGFHTHKRQSAGPPPCRFHLSPIRYLVRSAWPNFQLLDASTRGGVSVAQSHFDV